MRESFEYLISLSNKELRKEIENSNWSFILQELRYASEEIERLKIIEEKYKDSRLYIKDYKEEIENLRKDRKELFNENSNKEKVILKQQEVIDNAIEYIEKVESVNKELKDSDMYWAYNTFFPELLNILKGEDTKE